jgi:hypothetical protein
MCCRLRNAVGVQAPEVEDLPLLPEYMAEALALFFQSGKLSQSDIDFDWKEEEDPNEQIKPYFEDVQKKLKNFTKVTK